METFVVMESEIFFSPLAQPGSCTDTECRRGLKTRPATFFVEAD
jgi:hypothetical protein